MAHKNDKDLMSTDCGVHGREVWGPKIDYEQLKHDRPKASLPDKKPDHNMNSNVDVKVFLETQNE